jgi:hypothetical protein
MEHTLRQARSWDLQARSVWPSGSRAGHSGLRAVSTASLAN